MQLQELLNLSIDKNQKKIGVSPERALGVLQPLRSYIAFWREYPDLFVDFMQNGGDPEKPLTFKLFFYQRVFLRIAMRYKYVYAVFPRACENAPKGNKFYFLRQTSLIAGTLFFKYKCRESAGKSAYIKGVYKNET